MRILICFMLVIYLGSCRKDNALPEPDQRPVNSYVNCAAQSFPVCSGELVSYTGQISFHYTIRANVIHLQLNDSNFTGIANGNNYNITFNKDTSFQIRSRQVYNIPVNMSWLYGSHITYDLNALLLLKLTLNNDGSVKLIPGQFTMYCNNPPYLY